MNKNVAKKYKDAGKNRYNYIMTKSKKKRKSQSKHLKTYINDETSMSQLAEGLKDLNGM